jgi:hypothetical protein
VKKQTSIDGTGVYFMILFCPEIYILISVFTLLRLNLIDVNIISEEGFAWLLVS